MVAPALLLAATTAIWFAEPASALARSNSELVVVIAWRRLPP